MKKFDFDSYIENLENSYSACIEDEKRRKQEWSLEDQRSLYETLVWVVCYRNFRRFFINAKGAKEEFQFLKDRHKTGVYTVKITYNTPLYTATLLGLNDLPDEDITSIEVEDFS